MKCQKCPQDTGADWKTLCYSCYKNRSPEEIREQRQKKLDRKVNRLRSKAERLERIGTEKTASLDQYRGDTAFFTQPANPNSGFGKYRSKLYASVDKGMGFLNEAEKAKDYADWIESRGVQVKGDAERKREEKRKKADSIYKVGSKLYDFCFRDGVIVKVNKKTYAIKFESGSTFIRDKSYFV